MKNKKNVETIYLHRFKEDNLELVDKYKNDSFKFLGLEVSIEVEINENKGTAKILSIEGIEIDKEITL